MAKDWQNKVAGQIGFTADAFQGTIGACHARSANPLQRQR